jgi:hypothetical protein
VPLTNSLYVKGKLADPDRVIVDVGTGFYVEKVRLVGTEGVRLRLTGGAGYQERGGLL